MKSGRCEKSLVEESSPFCYHRGMNQRMTPHERLEAVFAGETPDRTPILGGWTSCPEHIAAIMGVSLAAYALLGADGLAGMTGRCWMC